MLKRCLKLSLLLALIGLVPIAAQAQDQQRKFKATLVSLEEVPLALSTPGTGTATVVIDSDDAGFDYELTYSDLSSNVLQAHTHLGPKGVAGGIMFFFCTNLGNGPAGTPACPVAGGTVTGRITAAQIVGPAGQGIAPGEFAEVLRAIRAGAGYANVHTATFPGGEMRGNLLHDNSRKP
jgi:hypothetical protein